MLPYDMDEECVVLCEAMNLVPGIRTVESCCGHGENPYMIFFEPKDFASLPPLLYWFDRCHCGFNGWRVEVYTDCSSAGPFFMVSGPLGEVAYEQAEKIAALIVKDQTHAETGVSGIAVE